MKKYKPKNQTYATAFKALLDVNHLTNIEFKEGHRWHGVALDFGVMHWFEEVDEFSHLPKSVKEIDGRKWFINSVSQVTYGENPTRYDVNNNCLSTKERAEAFLALMQLVELRDAWNEGWKWEGRWSYAIVQQEGQFKILGLRSTREVLCFKNSKTAKEFLDTFRDLIETAKELI